MTPWTKRDTETTKAHSAFIIYRDLGPQRSLQKAANDYYGKAGANVGQLERWSSQHAWVKRVAAYDEHQREEHERIVAEQFAEARRQQREQRQKTIQLMETMFQRVSAAYFPHPNRTDTTMSAQDFAALARGWATVMDQSRAEFNDLPTQRQEITGQGGGAIVFRTGMDADEL